MLLRSSERATFSASTTCDSSVRASVLRVRLAHRRQVGLRLVERAEPEARDAAPEARLHEVGLDLERRRRARARLRPLLEPGCVAARLVCSESSVGAAAASDVCFVR